MFPYPIYAPLVDTVAPMVCIKWATKLHGYNQSIVTGEITWICWCIFLKLRSFFHNLDEYLSHNHYKNDSILHRLWNIAVQITQFITNLIHYMVSYYLFGTKHISGNGTRLFKSTALFLRNISRVIYHTENVYFMLYLIHSFHRIHWLISLCHDIIHLNVNYFLLFWNGDHIQPEYGLVSCVGSSPAAMV